MKTNTKLVLVASNPVQQSVPTFRKDYTYEHWVKDLQGIAFQYFLTSGGCSKDLAVKAELGEKTVSNFVWGETKRPAARTVFQIAKALDIRCPFIPMDAPRQPDESDFSVLRASLPKGRP